jgi:thiol-disulfide isomerase/thioredoxin
MKFFSVVNVFVVIGLLISFRSFAQFKEVKPVKIGDKVPDISFNEILNYDKKTAKVSDFKGKILILDFWFTGCTVCIQQFNRFTELQNKFNTDLVILPVGFDGPNELSIKSFVLKRRNTKREIKLPIVVQGLRDSLLFKLFPTTEMPHEIWIGRDGKLLAITDHTAVNEKNISEVLNGENITFGNTVSKKPLDCSSPFLINWRPTIIDTTPRSLFKGYIDSLYNIAPFGKQCDPKITRLFDCNNTVYGLYKEAYGNLAFMDLWDKRIIVQNVKGDFYRDACDMIDLDNYALDEFREKNFFSYELILPEKYTLEQAKALMIKDIDTHFKINSSIEKRKVKCLALIDNSSDNKYQPSQTTYSSPEFSSSEDLLDVSMNNVSVKIVLDYLNNLPGLKNFIILDETGLKKSISLQIHISKDHNIYEIRSALKKYNLNIIEVEREIDFLVLRQKNN